MEYIIPVLISVLTAVLGFIGNEIKKVFQKRADSEEKQKTVRTVVKAVEQLYHDLHGEEKLEKAIESISEILTQKGIPFTDIEIRMAIESVICTMNESWKE